jgi:hypothetical protein
VIIFLSFSIHAAGLRVPSLPTILTTNITTVRNFKKPVGLCQHIRFLYHCKLCTEMGKLILVAIICGPTKVSHTNFSHDNISWLSHVEAGLKISRVAIRVVEGDAKRNSMRGSITGPTCHWGDISTVTWSSRLGVGLKTDKLALKKKIH